MRRRALLFAGVCSFIAALGSVPMAGQQAARPTTSSPAAAAPSPATQVAAAAPTPGAPHRAVLNRYCVTCHNQRLVTAGVALDTLDMDNVVKDAPVWEKVVRKLRTHSMPPAGLPRPDVASYDAVATYLETALDKELTVRPNPGRTVLRRLNRFEYTNAVRDLLGVEVDADSILPIDEVKFGFDNISSSLSVTPLLLERYMSAAYKIADLAVGETAVKPSSEAYPVDLFLQQDERMSPDLPFGSRGGTVVRHHFPVDGEYTVKVTLQRNSRGYVRGLFEAHQLEFRVDGARVGQVTIGGGPKMAVPGPPFSQAGTLGEEESDLYQLTDVDAHLEARFTAKAGSRLVGVTFIDEDLVPEGVLRPKMTEVDKVQNKGGLPAVEHIEVAGPFNPTGVTDTDSHKKIFVCRPASPREEEPCAQKILTSLARRAYRRSLTVRETQTLVGVYKSVRGGGEDFDGGIRAGISRILVGPEFLYRVERDPAAAAPNSVHRISDLEMATRLSFFLWSSVPDDELLTVAEQGKLKDPVVLEQQVRRMLADPRAESLVTNFAGQWLYLRNLKGSRPDPGIFTEFDSSLRDAFRQETELFVGSTIHEDQSVLRLIDANYTYLNERLAKHYGIPNVYGSHFRRVALDGPFDVRRGLMGQGSLLTVTSYANRTSVVLRGKWVLENILGAPPPPPPPNVPALERSGTIGKLPLRQLMQQHRANPVCAVCHNRMDPIGFSLENFDAIGQWRAEEGGAPIDASTVLQDGTAFEGPAGLRRVLVNQPDQFAGTIAERLLTYALGRGLEYYDQPAIRSIVREARQQDYRWSSLILATVKSMPFQVRKAEQR